MEVIQRTITERPPIRITDVSPAVFEWHCYKGHVHDSAAKMFRCEMGDE